jgi:hypothetical protein
MSELRRVDRVSLCVPSKGRREGKRTYVINADSLPVDRSHHHSLPITDMIAQDQTQSNPLPKIVRIVRPVVQVYDPRLALLDRKADDLPSLASVFVAKDTVVHEGWVECWLGVVWVGRG